MELCCVRTRPAKACFLKPNGIPVTSVDHAKVLPEENKFDYVFPYRNEFMRWTHSPYKHLN